ncbi:MAG: hypothetical protein P8168_00700 [Deltaproteobacteria bacterium]
MAVVETVAPGRYLAEFTVAAQGMWQMLNRWLPERFSTEMVYRQGRLAPLVYREEFVNHGQHVVREYRFDYESHHLTLWRQADDRAKVKKWQVPLNGPVYDLLSLLYNVRLGVLGPLLGGATLRVSVLSDKPHNMEFRIGPETPLGRKVMLDFRLPESDRVDSYFIYLNPDQVPTLAWTRVTLLGKLAGRLLNPGGIKKALLPEVASFSAPAVLGTR